MDILLVGLNYRSASVELREQFSVPEETLGEALATLTSLAAVSEAVLISTCNRTEVYVVTDDAESAIAHIIQFLSQLAGLSVQLFREHVYTEVGLSAVAHLQRLVTGLDSMVIGETQILGQVRQAFLAAQSAGATGTMLNALFRNTVAFGKRVQTETSIGQTTVSVSYAAVALARKVFTHLSTKTVLVIGAGKMSDLTLTHLQAQGVTRVFVANRTYERAVPLARKYGGQASDMTNLRELLVEADIVVSSTGARGYVLTPEMLEPVMRRRKQRPLFCIDIAVPRDIDPALARCENVYVYDIDDLQNVVAAGFALRKQEAERVLQMIDLEVAAFAAWCAEQDVVPLIAQLRRKATDIQEAVMDSLLHKMPELDDKQIKVLQKHTASIVNQLLRDPIASVKEMATEPGGQDAVTTFARIFALTTDEKPMAGDVTRVSPVLESEKEPVSVLHPQGIAVVPSEPRRVAAFSTLPAL